MQAFLGQINFVKRFIPGFSKIVMLLQNMIKNKIIYKWRQNERNYFESIKQEIIDSPSLSSPYFSKEFFLYTFTSK